MDSVHEIIQKSLSYLSNFLFRYVHYDSIRFFLKKLFLIVFLKMKRKKDKYNRQKYFLFWFNQRVKISPESTFEIHQSLYFYGG